MKSKHHGWQRRWAIDQAAGTFTHECGLQVRYIGPNDMQGAAINALEVIQALAEKNGHNAPAMVARMLREASELRQHGQAARINTKVAIPTTPTREIRTPPPTREI